jgi:hypothetical protein
VKRRTHGKHYGSPGASRPGNFNRAFNRSSVAGNHSLRRRIQIGWSAYAKARRFTTNRVYQLHIAASQGSHRSFALRHSILHELPSLANYSDRILKLQAPRGDQRRVLSKRVSGNEVTLNARRFERG